MIWIFRGMLTLGLLIFLYVAVATGFMLAHILPEWVSGTPTFTDSVTISVTGADGWRMSPLAATALFAGVFVVSLGLAVWMAWLVWTLKAGDR